MTDKPKPDDDPKIAAIRRATSEALSKRGKGKPPPVTLPKLKCLDDEQ